MISRTRRRAGPLRTTPAPLEQIVAVREAGPEHDVKRWLRQAVGNVAPGGWRPYGAGAVRRHDNDYWSQIAIHGLGHVDDPDRRTTLVAGVCSPYLMRLLDLQDPDEPPPLRFAASHAALVRGPDLVVVEEAADTEYEARRGNLGADHVVVLDATSGPRWFFQAVADLAPAADALCSDAALFDVLCPPSGEVRGSVDLRLAALVARAMGDPDRTAAALARAEARRLAEDDEARAEGVDPRPLLTGDDDRPHDDWPHDRFVRFLAHAPVD